MIRRNTTTWRRAGAGVVVAATAAVVLAAGGSLDAGFGSGGVATVDAGASSASQVSAVAVCTDGKSLVGGWANVGHVNHAGGSTTAWTIRRFTASGALDGAFGTGGLVTLLGENGGDCLKDVAIDANGRAVGAGWTIRETITVTGTGRHLTTTYTYTQQAAIARLRADGSLDASFGTGGVVRTSVAGTTSTDAQSLVVQPDGRIVIVGRAVFANGAVPGGYSCKPFLARYLADGSPDASFGSGGIALDSRAPNTFTVAGSVALQSTGRILVQMSRSPTPWMITRFTADGVIDAEFTAIAESATLGRIAVDRFDRIVGTGTTTSVGGAYGMRVVRYLADGAADGSFGTAGVVTINAYHHQQARTSALFQSADDKIVFGAVLGPVGAHVYATTTVRLTEGGALDSTYGSGGWGSLIDLGNATFGNDAASAPDGGVLLAGNATPTGSLLGTGRTDRGSGSSGP